MQNRRRWAPALTPTSSGREDAWENDEDGTGSQILDQTDNEAQFEITPQAPTEVINYWAGKKAKASPLMRPSSSSDVTFAVRPDQLAQSA